MTHTRTSKLWSPSSRQKKRPYFLWILLVLAALIGLLPIYYFTKGKESKEDLAPEALSSEPIASDTVYRSFMVYVDDLRVRSAPDLQSKVIGKLKEGTILHSKIDPSQHIEQVKLRDQEVSAPFYYVFGENVEPGWVFGGALVLFYRDFRPAPFTSRIRDFIVKIKSINPQDEDAGKNVLSLIQDFKASDPTWNDAIYHIGKYYFNRLPTTKEFIVDQMELLTEIDLSDSSSVNLAAGKFPFIAASLENGYRLTALNGKIYAERDGTRISQTIRGPFTEMLTQHLWLGSILTDNKWNKRETPRSYLKDLVDFLVAQQQAIINHPEFILEKEHVAYLEDLEKLLMEEPPSNSSIGDKSEKWKNFYQEAWQYSLKKYPNSSLSHKIITKYGDNLPKS